MPCQDFKGFKIKAMNWRCDHWHNKLLWLEPWGKVAKDIQSMSRLDLKVIILWTDCIMSMRSSFQWMELIWTPQQATDRLIFKMLRERMDVLTKTWEELSYLPRKVNCQKHPWHRWYGKHACQQISGSVGVMTHITHDSDLQCL